MFGNSVSRLKPYEAWNNGSQPPDAYYERRLSAVQQDTANYHAECRNLEMEIESLRERKRELDKKLAEVSEAREMFNFWGGWEVEEPSDSKLNVTLIAHQKGEICQKYSIGFKKLGQFWTVDYYNLPYSMKLIPHRVEEARIETYSKLCLMIRNLTHEVNLFVLREAQFEEAKSIESPMVRIYPSKSTTSLMLEFCVNDYEGSDLSEACVYLSYRPHKFLPEEPLFKFKGGDPKAQDDFKKQLITLEHMPLKAAILKAFPESSVSHTSILKETTVTPAPAAEGKLMDTSLGASDSQKTSANSQKSQPLPHKKSKKGRKKSQYKARK